MAARTHELIEDAQEWGDEQIGADILLIDLAE